MVGEAGGEWHAFRGAARAQREALAAQLRRLQHLCTRQPADQHSAQLEVHSQAMPCKQHCLQHFGSSCQVNNAPCGTAWSSAGRTQSNATLLLQAALLAAHQCCGPAAAPAGPSRASLQTPTCQATLGMAAFNAAEMHRCCGPGAAPAGSLEGWCSAAPAAARHLPVG